MVDRVIAVDSSGNCKQKELVPYPSVVSSNNTITVTSSTDGNGKTIYDVVVTHDINMDVVGFDPNTMIITMKETDGDTFNVNLSSLTSTVDSVVSGHLIARHISGDGTIVNISETITKFESDGASLKYTDEQGNATSVPVCDLLSAVPQSSEKIGG